MYENHIASMLDFLSRREGELRREAKALAADSRTDESNFLKIRANVFGIFRAVLETAVNTRGKSHAALEFFSAKLRDIPGSWRKTLSAASDSEAALVEKLKLQSVWEIEKAFARIKEEAT